MHHTAPRPLLTAALTAAERGWHVFPLLPGRKQPAIRSWESRATTDQARIARCWSAADHNIGIATGPSVLVVVDLDVPKHPTPSAHPMTATDGAAALARLAEEYGERYPADTYTVRTPSGGTHLYFTAPTDAPQLRNTAGRLAPKIDTRAHGGYVVAAASTADGHPYTVLDDAPAAPLPQWLTALLTPTSLPPQVPVTATVRADDAHAAYLNAAVRAETARVRDAHPGRRNDDLYVAAVALGQLVAGGHLDPAEVTDHLTAAALHTGLKEPDARHTIASGLRTGAKRPRTLGTTGRRTAA